MPITSASGSVPRVSGETVSTAVSRRDAETVGACTPGLVRLEPTSETPSTQR